MQGLFHELQLYHIELEMQNVNPKKRAYIELRRIWMLRPDLVAWVFRNI